MSAVIPRGEGGKAGARIRVMAEEEIRFGLRRYPLAVVFFVGGGIGFTAWSRMIERPTFVFPFGTLDPATARPLLLAVGVAAILYAAVISYIRFVRRPAIRLGKDAVSIPVGELGLSVVTIRAGQVLRVDVGARRVGGWRTCAVSHRGGTLALRSSQLPDDEAFFRVCRKLEALTLQRVRSRSA